jgi:hypothetical protein
MTPQPNNYVPGVRRRQYTPLYDTLVLSSGAQATLLTMFGRTAGGSGINVTNMTKAYELPGTEAFLLNALRVVPLTISEADWILLVKGYIVRFIRGRAVELEAGLEFFTGGAGIVTPLATSTTAVSNGIADPRAVASLMDEPIRIEGTDRFEVQLVGPSAVTTAGATWLRVYLDGAYDKGVQ